jgi:hypothetical protein
MKTPVEWLEDEIKKLLDAPLSPKFKEIFKHAKAYEIEQICRAFVCGGELGEISKNKDRKFEIDAKIYFNEKYE